MAFKTTKVSKQYGRLIHQIGTSFENTSDLFYSIVYGHINMTYRIKNIYSTVRVT